MKDFLKKLFCSHYNWSNKPGLFGKNLKYDEYFKIRRSKPWPYGENINTYFCVRCGKIKDFGWYDYGYFSTPKLPLNYNYEIDYYD